MVGSRCGVVKLWWLYQQALQPFRSSAKALGIEALAKDIAPRSRDGSMHARLANSAGPICRRALSSFPRNSSWIYTSCRTRSNRNRHTSTQSTSEKPYYITTPIFYVNAAPHVGHLYTMVLTDIIKRWQVLKGKKALLLTGTDEHGLKVRNYGEQEAGMYLYGCRFNERQRKQVSIQNSSATKALRYSKYACETHDEAKQITHT